MSCINVTIKDMGSHIQLNASIVCGIIKIPYINLMDNAMRILVDSNGKKLLVRK